MLGWILNLALGGSAVETPVIPDVRINRRETLRFGPDIRSLEIPREDRTMILPRDDRDITL